MASRLVLSEGAERVFETSVPAYGDFALRFKHLKARRIDNGITFFAPYNAELPILHVDGKELTIALDIGQLPTGIKKRKREAIEDEHVQPSVGALPDPSDANKLDEPPAKKPRKPSKPLTEEEKLARKLARQERAAKKKAQAEKEAMVQGKKD